MRRFRESANRIIDVAGDHQFSNQKNYSISSKQISNNNGFHNFVSSCDDHCGFRESDNNYDIVYDNDFNEMIDEGV